MYPDEPLFTSSFDVFFKRHENSLCEFALTTHEDAILWRTLVKWIDSQPWVWPGGDMLCNCSHDTDLRSFIDYLYYSYNHYPKPHTRSRTCLMDAMKWRKLLNFIQVYNKDDHDERCSINEPNLWHFLEFISDYILKP